MSEGVLVFGATGSVGTAVCRLLADRDARLHVAGRQPDAVAAELGVTSSVVDVADSGTFAKCFSEASESLGTITGVVNCIGSVLLKGAHVTTDEEWRQTLSVNLDSAFFTLRESAKAMRKNGGSVVFCSTAAAQVGLANHEAIAAAKAGVDGLVRSAAATYGPKNLRVNSVAPGLVKSEMTRRIWENEASASASQEMHVLGRLGEPEDVARLIAFLLDPVNSWITGQTLGVDGGLGGIVNRVRQRG